VQAKVISKGTPPFFDRFGEGIALFDPLNKTQARLALKLTGARVRKVLTPEQKTALAARLAEARKAPVAQTTDFLVQNAL
jgi:hypothetical protein